VPVSDTLHRQDASIKRRDRHARHSATRSLVRAAGRRVVVASNQRIYGLGIPSEYLKAAVNFRWARASICAASCGSW